jgi:excisionase family DNA binding protein
MAEPENHTTAAQGTEDDAASRELTTREAADLLNVSESFLLTLLEDGTLPSARIEGQLLLCASDVLAYKHARSKERRKLLAEMTEIAQRSGAYD